MKGLMDNEGLPYIRRSHTSTADSPRSSQSGPRSSPAATRSTMRSIALFRRRANIGYTEVRSRGEVRRARPEAAREC